MSREGQGTRAEQLCFSSGLYPDKAGAQCGNTGLTLVIVTEVASELRGRWAVCGEVLQAPPCPDNH